MNRTQEETRETFRDYAINNRAIYERIANPARILAANLRAAIYDVNKEHAEQTGETDLIATDDDKRAAIEVYLAEVAEVLTWELIGKEHAEQREAGK